MRKEEALLPQMEGPPSALRAATAKRGPYAWIAERQCATDLGALAGMRPRMVFLRFLELARIGPRGHKLCQGGGACEK